MSYKPLPTFKTDRLILREVTHEDIPSYEKYFINYEVIQHLASHVPWPYPKNGVREFLDNFIFPDQGKTQWLWGVYEKENQTILNVYQRIQGISAKSFLDIAAGPGPLAVLKWSMSLAH